MKKPIYKRWWFIVVASLIVIYGLSAIAYLTDDETTSEDNNKTVETSAPVEEKEEVNPIDEVVKSVIDGKFEVISNAGIVNITIEDKRIHEGSKRALLRDSGEIFAGLSKLEEVKAPTIYWNAPLTDQYGNESMGEVLVVGLTADTFEKVNWDNVDNVDLEAISDGFKQHQTLKD